MTAVQHPVGHDAQPDMVSELRTFLRSHHPGPAPRGRDERLSWQQAWAATLFDAGWAGPAWPRRWGGMELGLLEQVAYHREVAAAGAPAHPCPNLGTIGPTLIVHGTDAQRARYLRPLLRGDELWAQGFSEPDAGSDLAALATTARRDGDHYEVTGTKVWSTMADRSHWLFALVRTGPPGSGRSGISYLLIDLRSPGVTVSPIRDLTGSAGFCEVRLDGVRVPLEQRVGAENGGWPIARTSLGHERSAASAARAHRYLEIVSELVSLAVERGRHREPTVRQQLAELHTLATILRIAASRALDTVLRDGQPGASSSTTRLFHALFEQRLHEVAVDVLGMHGALVGRGPDVVQGGRWTWGFLRTRASTIGAGTAEIQRTTIAERVLGLPREPEPPAPGRERVGWVSS